jgi:protein ImuA
MRFIRVINGLLQTVGAEELDRGPAGRVRTGLAAIDDLTPGGGLATGAVHEVLSRAAAPSMTLAVLIARAAAKNGWIVWCDPTGRFYPPGAAALGLPLERLVLLRPLNDAQQIWAATECLRSAGVGACIVAPARLSFTAARKLQLAAERGGGLGLVLRDVSALNRPYAAMTRWLIGPAPGDRTVQRWSVRLSHGHGGCADQSVLLEVCHETHHVRAIAALADRAREKTAASA